MKKYKSLTKIIATFMAFIITFVAMPTQAIALYIDDSEISEENIFAENNSEVEQAEVFIVEEDTSKRGQFEKHYLCSDGTYVSVTYPEAVHYLDSNQVWQDVDQSLTYDSKTGTYKSEKADFKVSFSETFSSTNIAQIERNGYSLSWGIQTAKKTAVEKTEIASVKPNIMETESTEIVITPSLNAQAQVISTPTVEFDNFSDRLISREDSFALPDISSQISYSDVLNGSESVSVRYTVYHNKIEEDIIISNRGDIRSVSMNMDIGTLTPIVNEDGSVDLVDANNVMQFRIGIPYMMDADFSVCNDISVTAEKVGSNCIITYTPDLEWFSSEDRTFPIILDPSVTTNDYVSNIEDTYVEENSTVNHTSEQYLQIYPNGTNRRRAIVRVLELPTVDETMPIISANLKLTAQYTPFSNVSLKASLGYTGFEMDEFTYSATNGILYTYVTYGTLNQGGYTVVFDCSSYIYEMYDNQQIYDEPRVDFVIDYANDGDTTLLYPFYSSEYTVPANRPVFTVRYGYTLPAGILSGQIYSFKNYESGSYMSVNGTDPANNSNIYQLKNDSNVALTTQKFKLEYVSATGGYLLRSLSSSSGTDKVVSIDRSGGEITGGQNVRLSSPSDSVSQEWLIIPVDYDMFKIVPRANMNYALTAYWYSDGSNTGTGGLSAGNIFIQIYSGSDNFQHWYVYDNSDNQLDTSEFRLEIESGNYFISNDYTGRYLHKTGKVANCMSGTTEDLGEDSIKLKIVNLGDGYCTIQPTDLVHYYLAPSTSSNGSAVRFVSSVSETISDNYKWSVRLASGGGYLIQNKATGYYLSAVSSTENPSSVCMYALNSAGTVAYQKQVWLIATEDEYIELDHRVSFNDLVIDPGEPTAASINKKPSGAYWSTYRNFDYTITSGSEYVSYDESTHKFTGIKRASDSSTEPAVATVTATHKTTGISDTFTIKVNRNAIIIIPGILGSELFVGEGNPYFEEGMPLFSKDIVEGLSTYQDGDTVQDLIPHKWWEHITNVPSIWRLYTGWHDSMSCVNTNGNSKYNVYTKEYRSDDDSSLNNNCGAGNVYITLYNKLVESYSNEYAVDLFSYDWRLSNSISASNLNEYIEFYNYDKVILIAHSMGGLVASGYLGLGPTQRNKVEQIFYLASPLLGSPTIANVWYNEDISFAEEAISSTLGLSLENFNRVYKTITEVSNPLQNLICNYVSVYELFPSEYSFALTGTSYMSDSFSHIAISEGFTVTECSTYATTRDILTGRFDNFDSNLMSLAEAFHNTTFISGNHVSSYVDSYYYYCVNNELSTISHLDFYRIVSSSSYVDGLDVNGFSDSGDGLVLSASASLANSYPSKCDEFIGDHMTLVTKSSTIVSWISNID